MLHTVVAGAGWDLAQSLLRPRSIEVDDDGRVSFVSTGGIQRIGAQEALRHRFLRPAAEHERNLKRSLGSVSDGTISADQSMDDPLSSGSSSRYRSGSGGRRAVAATAARNGRGGSSASGSGSASAESTSGSGSSRSGSGWWGLGRKKVQPVPEEEEEEPEPVPAAAGSSASGGLFSAAAGLWRGMQDRLFDLEARMIKTASETAKQTTKVQKLEAKVSSAMHVQHFAVKLCV